LALPTEIYTYIDFNAITIAHTSMSITAKVNKNSIFLVYKRKTSDITISPSRKKSSDIQLCDEKLF